jgi:hypothetical protein
MVTWADQQRLESVSRSSPRGATACRSPQLSFRELSKTRKDLTPMYCRADFTFTIETHMPYLIAAKRSSRLSTRRPIIAVCSWAVLTGILGCVSSSGRASERPATSLPTAERFDEVLRPVLTTPLGGNADSMGMIVGGVVQDSRIVLLDLGRGELRLYRRSTGRLISVAGHAGDGFGDLREPFAAASLDSGRFVVYDNRRSLMSFRDSVGTATAEVRLPHGYIGGFAVWPSEKRAVLTGTISDRGPALKGRDIHEFDFTGKHVGSFGRPAPTHSDWENRFAAEFSTLLGSTLVTGTMSSNRLRFRDRDGQSERWIEVAPGWQRLDWPSDRLLGSINRSTASTRIRKWSSAHRLMNGAFPLGADRLLVRFATYTDGRGIYVYAIVDTTGNTLQMTRATRANVFATKGDTVFWIGQAADKGRYMGVSVANSRSTVVSVKAQ